MGRNPKANSPQYVLEVRGVFKTFGGLTAVNDVSFNLPWNQITALIGPNGAGKTTLLNLIGGLQKLDGGEIRFQGKKLNDLAPHKIAALGIARTFQHIELFADMSVVENVMVGCHTRSYSSFLDIGLRLPSARREEERIYTTAMDKLTMVGLANKASSYPSALSLGQQKQVALARAMAMEPQMLLLDEPAAGLSSGEVRELASRIQTLRSSGVTILVVEHLMDLVMDIADRIVVLDYGVKIAEGTPSEIQLNERVIAAYLGEEGQG